MANVGFFSRRFFHLSYTRETKLFSESLKRSSVPKLGNLRMRGILEKRYSKAYEAEGKTVAFVLNKKTADVMCVTMIKNHGFIMASGEEYGGPVILFPHSVLSWHVNSARDISEESLVLFKVIEPTLDILIFGYGSRKDYTPEIHHKFNGICKKLGLRFEALPTEQACGIFNFLALEHRFVAGAFIPPTEIDVQRLRRSKDISLDDLDGELKEKSEFDLLEENKDKKFIQ